jgi:hypothetical protein
MTHGSYLLIEPGLTIRGVDGDIIGVVTELIADENADIFRGIVASLATPLSNNGLVFVPGEHITAVESQTVFTDLSSDAAGRLEAVASGSSES